MKPYWLANLVKNAFCAPAFIVCVVWGLGVDVANAAPAKKATSSMSKAGSPGKKVEPVMYETRLSTAPFGTVQVLIGSSGLRMEFRKSGNVLLATAPQWKVIMYNPGSKRIYFHPKDIWTGGSTQKYLQMMSRSPRDLLWVKDSADAAKVHYKSDQPAIALSSASKKRLRRFISRAQLVTDISRKDIPAQALSILDKTLGVPDVEGFPISMSTTSSTQEQSTFFEQSKGFKTVSFQKQLLEIPKNFEKVDSEGKVESASAEALINDMAN